MKRIIAVLALPLCLLGFAPARVDPAPDPPAARVPGVSSPDEAFSEPRCLATVGDPKLRLKCYRAVLQAHLHHWSEEDVGVDRSILDWHAQKAWDIYVESASFVAAKEGSYSRTQISQYMYLASLVIMTDVYAEHYATDPRVKRICVAADAALKLAWQKT
jgi:hypothetical protein